LFHLSRTVLFPFALTTSFCVFYNTGVKWELERFKKYCSHSGKDVEAAVFLIFGFRLRQGYGGTSRFGSVTGFIKRAPSPKPRQKPKILAAKWLQFF
jgi:hypothetical protein